MCVYVNVSIGILSHLSQSVRVLDFLYSIPWYRMDRALRRDMLFIQLFSRRPLKLTGGKFFVMDYQKFVAVCATDIRSVEFNSTTLSMRRFR